MIVIGNYIIEENDNEMRITRVGNAKDICVYRKEFAAFNIFKHLFGDNNDWSVILDEFRSTDIYRKSGGTNLFALFFAWLDTNYVSPKIKK